MIVVITEGDRGRIPNIPGGPRQFAHRYEAKSIEGFDGQATNFLIYSRALGESDGPHVLIACSEPDELDEIQMSDWCQVVSTAANRKVEVQR
jgi:hypothetical protein